MNTEHNTHAMSLREDTSTRGTTEPYYLNDLAQLMKQESLLDRTRRPLSHSDIND